jgi:hypothetical protein
MEVKKDRMAVNSNAEATACMRCFVNGRSMFFGLQPAQYLDSSLVLGAQRRPQHSHGELIKLIPAKATSRYAQPIRSSVVYAEEPFSPP